MPRTAKVVSAALVAKGMVVDENHHTMYRKSLDGVTTLVTRISHSATDVGDSLGSLMAKQCALRLREFWQLVDCDLSEQDWDALIVERCVGGRNPFLNR